MSVLNTASDDFLESQKQLSDLFLHLLRTGEVLVLSEPDWSAALGSAVLVFAFASWLTRWLELLGQHPLLRDGLSAGLSLLVLLLVLVTTSRWRVRE